MRELKITNKYTIRNGITDSYLNELHKLPLISPEEEVELVRKVKKGDAKARKRLIEANLRFVVSVAKQYQFQGLSLSDLINEGNIGLIKAVDRFDETLGFKFISYAVWWIRQSIIEAINEKSRTIKIPSHNSHNLIKINNFINGYIHEHGVDPTIEIISSSLKINEKDITSIFNADSRHLCLDDGVELSSSSKTDFGVDKESCTTELKNALKTILKVRDMNIIVAYFGIGEEAKSCEEIGIKYGLSRERVRQVKEASLKKIRKSNVEFLKKYLE